MQKMSPFWVLAIVLGVLVIGGAAYAYFSHSRTPLAPIATETTVSYSCTKGSITAVYATSSVALVLSDGRSLALPQVRSGSGIRYETSAGLGSDITFASKGSDAFLEENGSVTYSNCVAGTQVTATTTPAGKTIIFTDSSKTFSFSYSAPLTVSGGGIGYSTDWMQNATTTGLVLAVVTLPQSSQPSTNFQGGKLTIGTSADPAALSECLTYNSSGGPVAAPSVKAINGTTYAVFHASDAGAGNFYETTSYRTLRNDQCYAVEYTIHTTNIGNYSPDQGIKAYDRAKAVGALEAVVQSFKFL